MKMRNENDKWEWQMRMTNEDRVMNQQKKKKINKLSN